MSRRRWRLVVEAAALALEVTTLALTRIWSSPTPALSVDRRASILDVSIEIPPPDDNGLSFGVVTLSQKGNAVSLEPGDKIELDGVELTKKDSPPGNPSYSAPPSPVPASGVYEFVYKHKGTSTTIRVPVLTGPKILSPRPGEILDRAAGLTVTYTPTAGAGQIAGYLSQTTTDANGYQTATGISGPDELDLGTYQFDPAMLTGLKPGRAWLQIYKQVSTSLQNTGFHSVAVSDAAATGEHVQWR